MDHGSLSNFSRRCSRGHAAARDTAHLPLLKQHIERHIGPVVAVIHEIESIPVRIDVHIVAPRPERPCFTLVTSGMSALPMPGGCEHAPVDLHAELMMCLPPDWPFALEPGQVCRKEALWPPWMLAGLASYPHRNHCLLWETHTVEEGDGPQEGSPFHGVILHRPTSLPEEARALHVSSRKSIDILCVYPLYKKELEFRLKQRSSDALWRRLCFAGVTDVLDPKRASVV